MLFTMFFVLTEAFENAYINWVKQGATEEAVELAVDAFKLLKQRQILKGSEGDISSWVKKPFTEFQQFVQEKQALHQQKNLQKQTVNAADKVFENDLCIVVVPHTYEASCKYGANTKWCTTASKTDRHWNQYKKENIKFYYIIPKDGSNKFAVAVYPHNVDITDITMETYNALDKLIKLEPVIKKFQIPKTIFKNGFTWDSWLKQHKHQIHEDGSVSIFENVDISNQKLKKLPFKFREVTGDFNCYNNQLTSLQDVPQKVGGTFSCNMNQLTDLLGGPKIVRGSYYCSNNQLTSLAGVASKIGGELDCSDNQLTQLTPITLLTARDIVCDGNIASEEDLLETLSDFKWEEWLKQYNHQIHEDGSVSIFGDVDLINKQLNTLPFRFREVTGNFYCHLNKLTSLNGSPQKVSGNFNCSYNQLSSLKGGPKIVGGNFNCSYNRLSSLKDAPQKVSQIFCSSNLVSKKQLLHTRST